GLGGAVDQVLGLLEAEAGGLADDLDDLDLLVAAGLEDDVEGGLLLGRRRAAAGAAGRGGRHDDAAAGRGLDAVGLLHVLAEFDGVLEGEAGERIAEFLNRGHGSNLAFGVRDAPGVPCFSPQRGRPIRPLTREGQWSGELSLWPRAAFSRPSRSFRLSPASARWP